MQGAVRPVGSGEFDPSIYARSDSAGTHKKEVDGFVRKMTSAKVDGFVD